MNFDFLKKVPVGGVTLFTFTVPATLLSFAKFGIGGTTDVQSSAVYSGGLIQFVAGCLILLAGQAGTASIFCCFGILWIIIANHRVTYPNLPEVDMGGVFLIVMCFVIVKVVLDCHAKVSIVNIAVMVILVIFCLLNGVFAYIDITNMPAVGILIGVVGAAVGILGTIYGSMAVFNHYVGRRVIPLLEPTCGKKH
eukprot:gnl/Chilomastix_caulleri/1833.p1 GENE.gnl/Chilomastix_caulleri/1833~~gnl/Chilomastix_caulleri/1833.p1  ORF type:complete len:195 (+),score=10.26 gnl/Chilomastix_caulleri/1833:134-718(+)